MSPQKRETRPNEPGDKKDTACSYLWLSRVQFEMGDFREAVESLQTASRLRRAELFGEEHTDTADRLQLPIRVYKALCESELD